MKYITAGSFRWRPEVWEGGRRQEVFLHVVLQAEEEHSEGVKKEEPVFFGGVRPGQEPPEGFSGGFRAGGLHVSLGRHQSLQNCLLLALGWGMK